MATKINKKNLLALCSPKKEVVKTATVVVIKRGRPCSTKTIRKFVLENINKMNSYEMAQVLNVKPIRIAAAIATLKRYDILDKDNNPTGKEFQPKTVVVPETRKESKKMDWAARPKKAEARNLIFDFIVNSGLYGLILTLPAAEGILESMLHKQSKKHSFFACELKPKIFFEMLKNVAEKKLPFTDFHLGYISDVIFNAVKNQFAHLVLDYCGTFKSFKNEIDYALSVKTVRVNGIVAMTFSKRDGSSLEDVTTFLSRFKNYEIVKTFEYHEDSFGARMMLIIVKRIK